MKSITRTEFNDLKKDLNKTKKELSVLKKCLDKSVATIVAIKDFIEKGGIAGKGVLMKCFKCSYPWLYKGQLTIATCPNCSTKNEVPQR